MMETPPKTNMLNLYHDWQEIKSDEYKTNKLIYVLHFSFYHTLGLEDMDISSKQRVIFRWTMLNFCEFDLFLGRVSCDQSVMNSLCVYGIFIHNTLCMWIYTYIPTPMIIPKLQTYLEKLKIKLRFPNEDSYQNSVLDVALV